MNCNDTLTYAHELKRMCESFHACVGCPLRPDKNCLTAITIDPAHIKIVQEWSDEHQTYTVGAPTISTYVSPDTKNVSTNWTTSNSDSIQYSPIDFDSLKK